MSDLVVTSSDRELSWTKEALEKILHEKNIVYDGHSIYAIQIIAPLDNSKYPFFKFLIEDDGSLYDTHFEISEYWVLDLIKELADTENLWKRMKELFIEGKIIGNKSVNDILNKENEEEEE